MRALTVMRKLSHRVISALFGRSVVQYAAATGGATVAAAVAAAIAPDRGAATVFACTECRSLVIPIDWGFDWVQ